MDSAQGKLPIQTGDEFSGLFDLYLPSVDRDGDKAISAKEAHLFANSKKTTGQAAVFASALEENFGVLSFLGSDFDDVGLVNKSDLDEFDRRVATRHQSTFTDGEIDQIKVVGHVDLSMKLTNVDLASGGTQLSYKELKDKAVALKNRLQDRFGIKISKPDQIINPVSLSLFDENTDLVYSRSPRYFEMVALNEALTKSAPSHILANGKKGLQFTFLKDRKLNNDAAHFVPMPGKEAIYVEPVLGETNTFDAEPEKVQKFLVHCLTHELGHNGQLKLGWFNKSHFKVPTGTSSWLLKESSTALSSGERTIFSDGKSIQTMWSGSQYKTMPVGIHGRKVASEIGWAYDPSIKDLAFRLKDGKLFHPDSLGDLIDWSQTSAKDNLLTRKIGTRSIRELASVKPVSDYFCNPVENANEAMTDYRLGGMERLTLLRTSPKLYEVIKREDQTEINMKYGTNAKGQPNKIRNPHGGLFSNSAKHRAIIEQFESK